MGLGKGMYILGIGQMDHVGSILLLLKPWMGYDYTVIQVICWVELPEQTRLCSVFVKIWISINGHNSVVLGHLKSTRIPRVDGLSMGPPNLGLHTYLKLLG